MMRLFSSIRDWAFGVGRSAFSSSLALCMIAMQCVLCVALVASLSWNIHQARDRTAALAASYEAGRVDGINWSLSAMIAGMRQMIEDAARQEQEQEAEDHIAEEKL